MRDVLTVATERNFYRSREWRTLRYQVLVCHGGRCQCCGSLGPLHVDHIKPRKTHPHLSLVFSNLQVLCKECNLGKSAIDETDWRKKRRKIKLLNTNRLIKAIDEFVWAGGKLRR